MRFSVRAALVVLAGFAAYAVGLRNRYALDDDLVIVSNIAVQRGIAGIPEIFANDSYAGFFETFNTAPQLAGGRYRPLALTTFAIEQSLFGKTYGDEYRRLTDVIQRSDLLETTIRDANLAIAPLRHGVSIALYLISMVLLLLLLERHILPDQPLIAFATTLLFTLHPIHTEVVANIKSRDEILSLLFIVCCLLFAFRFEEKRRTLDFALSLLSLALALLSKEYAVMMPIVLVVAIVVVRKRPPMEVARRWVPAMAAVIVAYAAIRFAAAGLTARTALVDRDLINDPFLPLRFGAVAGDILATKIAILMHYLRLLVVPYPLSADYSYATFPFVGWTDWRAWLSIAIHGALIAGTVLAWRRRHILALAGCVYFAFLLPVSNLPFDIGATMGERLIYHASLGFVLAASWMLVQLDRKVAVIATAAIAIAFGTLTFARTRNWYDDATLFLHDVNVVPNSAMANANAGSHLTEIALARVKERRIEKQSLSPADRQLIAEVTNRARPYLEKAIAIHPRFANAWINLGLLHWTRDELDAATDAWAHAAEIFPSHPILARYGTNLHVMGDEAARRGDMATASVFYGRAARVLPGDPQMLRDLAGANFMSMHFDAARAAFDRLLTIDPNDANAQQGRFAAAGLEQLERDASGPAATREQIEQFAAALESNGHPAFRQRAAALRRTLR
ncbi:MAG TPA: glycosyltransferase family 39 protein [Thermoanaerobaculia bacterium]|nr:glycosyltransferase family 39 protein [Thermoanaerobaculia bacterium]